MSLQMAPMGHCKVVGLCEDIIEMNSCEYETTSRTVLAPAIPDNDPCYSCSTSAATTKLINTEKYVGVDVQGHFVAVGHCPVGIDAERVKRDT